MGLEHVMFPVRDLARTTIDFQDKLGFAISPGGVHSSGMEDNAVSFLNEGYIELLGIRDRERDTPSLNEYRRFLRVREGPIGWGVRVSSAVEAAARLRSAGFEVGGPHPQTFPDPVTGKPSPPMWWSLEVLGHRKYLSDVLFFTQKVEGAWEAYVKVNADAARIQHAAVTTHPNTALGIAAAWLAVDDVERAKATYEVAGFRTSAAREYAPFQARLVEVAMGAGQLMLVEPHAAGSGLPAEVLASTREACSPFGISVRVSNLQTAQRVLPKEAILDQSSSTGWFGPNLVLSPEYSHGCWIELFERSDSPP
jgi:catechol 2,3-dioxygenase-like lactoylglutathione lyase family enzyme